MQADESLVPALAKGSESDQTHGVQKTKLLDVLTSGHERALLAQRPAPRPIPLVISLLSLRPPQREMAMDGRSLRPSEVLSTPLSAPELPTDCGDWLADRAPLSACLGSPEGSPLEGGGGHSVLRVFLVRGFPHSHTPNGCAIGYPSEKQRTLSSAPRG